MITESQHKFVEAKTGKEIIIKVSIDVDKIAERMAVKVVQSMRRRATAMHGAVKAKQIIQP